MIQRLIKIIKSLVSNEIITDDKVSTTIDDTREGKRLMFNKEDVNKILIENNLMDLGNNNQSDELNSDSEN